MDIIYPSEITETLRCFKSHIGEHTLRKICSTPELQLSFFDIETNALVLTKEVVRKIFIGYAALPFNLYDVKYEVTITDMAELQHGLMGACPSLPDFYNDQPSSSGYGLNGLIEKIYLQYHQYFSLKNNPDINPEKSRVLDAEFLTSRMADRELQEGNCLFLSNGSCVVEKNFIGGGAYVSLIKSNDDAAPYKLVCRGTASRSTATQNGNSVLNDLLLEIGTMGVKTIWNELQEYLIELRINKIDILGKSLGGAHAQQLTVLIEGLLGIKVNSLTTVCSVGVGDEINLLFQNEILLNRDEPFNLFVIRNGGDGDETPVDYVPCVGGVHLGEGAPEHLCNKEILYIAPAEREITTFPQIIQTISAKKSICELPIVFIRSFSTHSRQCTLEDFTIRKIIDPQKIDTQLRTGRMLEPSRRFIATIFHIMSLCLINDLSFTEFYSIKKL